MTRPRISDKDLVVRTKGPAVGRRAIRLRRALVLCVTILIISPSRSRAGIDVWTSNGPEGGGVPVLAIAPSNPATLYAGSPGWVFKSTDGGASWTDLDPGLHFKGIRLIAIDPTDSATVYATSVGNHAIFKSTDGGASWATVSTGLISKSIRALAIDPVDPSTLYAGGIFPIGVAKSTDAGATWTPLNAGLSKVNAFAIDPVNRATVYAATVHGVFKTLSGGALWTSASTGLPTFASGAPVDIDRLAIDPTDPATLYASGREGIFKSSDGGSSWSAMNTGFSPFNGTLTEPEFLAIDPQDPAILYGKQENTVFRSTDAAASWSVLGTGFPLGNVPSFAIDPSNSTTLYMGAGTRNGVAKSLDGGSSWSVVATGFNARLVGALAIDPTVPGTLYAGTATGGVFKSADGGTSWVTTGAGLPTDPSTGILRSVRALAIDPAEPATLYASADGGGVFKTIDGAANWAAINTGLTTTKIFALAIDPVDPTTVYTGTGDGIFKTLDGGATWAAANTGLVGTRINALAINPADPSTLYAGTNDDGVFKSSDGGANWAAINVGLTNTRIRALAIDPADPSTLYAGSFGGGVIKSVDGGTSWTAASTGLGPPISTLAILKIAIDPVAPSTLYVSPQGGGIFKSVDGGANWRALNAGIHRWVNSLAIDPSTPTTVYAGVTGGGVFRIDQICGNATLDAGEQCDQGIANGSEDSCCTLACEFRTDGEVCGPAAGVCDAVETCNGAGPSCPPDTKDTAQCRAPADLCDAAESCDGIGNDCPTDLPAASGTECRSAVGACDAIETCDGVGASCPADAKSTSVCRGAAGECDVSEICDGVSDDCPVDDFVAAGITCTDDADMCTFDQCDGSGACSHPPAGADTDGDGVVDICDPCPAKFNNVCDPDGSASEMIGSGGGTVSTPNTLIEVMLPPGAVDQDTPISITDNTVEFRLGSSVKLVYRVELGPGDLSFNKPAVVTFRWPDAAGDSDAFVDIGTCADGLTACSNDTGCLAQSKPGPCSGGGSLQEAKLVLKKNSNTFSTLKCSDPAHMPGGVCESATAADALGGCGRRCATDRMPCTTDLNCSGGQACIDPVAVAGCCDSGAGAGGIRDSGEWTFETCSFSEWFLGEMEGDLIPGNGSVKTDCIAEWAVLNPFNDPAVDKKGLVSSKQTCTDGDPFCDQDAAVNGTCSFRLGLCFNVDDGRLLKGGAQQCTPSDIQRWQIKKPRPDSRRPTNVRNGVALRGAIEELAENTVGGKHQDVVTFTSAALSTEDRCSGLVNVDVLLRGSRQDKKGKATFRVRSVTSVAAGKARGTTDTDVLQLICLPPAIGNAGRAIER